MTTPRLPQRPMVTDGGLETVLIFHHGVDLPDFAAFPLIDDPAGRTLLRQYYDGYAAIARRASAGLMLESATWRANPDWAARLGYSGAELARVNRDAISMLHDLRDAYAAEISAIEVCGTLGPRGDGYRPGDVAADEAAEYHRPQIAAFADAGADIVTVYTLTDVGEAIGVVRAARDVAVPVAVSFTVETDGRLPHRTSLANAIEAVDAAAAPDYFLVNCAHPSHVEAGLGDAAAGTWRERIRGTRCNASTKSHAELDDADELDEGDPAEFGAAHQRLQALLPAVSIVGGCCGTDARHVAALWSAV